MRKFGLVLAILTGFFSSCVGINSNPIIPGIDGPKINLADEHILIAATFQNWNIPGGGRFHIPGSIDSYVELSPDLFGGTLMSVGLSFEDVFGRKVEDLVPMGLPGGRPLPDDPDGRKPAVAFSVANFNYMVFYLDETHYGLFFPWSININIPIGMDYYVGGKPVGKIYFISQDFSGKNGGFMLMLKRDYSLIKMAKRFKKYLK